MSQLFPARSATTLPTHAPTIAPDNGRESRGLPWGQSAWDVMAQCLRPATADPRRPPSPNTPPK